MQADNIAGRGHDLVGHILQRLQAAVAAVLDDDLEAARRPQAFQWRRTKDVDQAIADFLLQSGLQADRDGVAGELGRGSLVEVIQHDEDGAKVGSIGVQEHRLTRDRDGVFDTRRLQGDLFNAVHDLLGPLHRCRVGELHIDQEVPFVLGRDETFGSLGETEVGESEEAAVDDQDHDADAE